MSIAVDIGKAIMLHPWKIHMEPKDLPNFTETLSSMCFFRGLFPKDPFVCPKRGIFPKTIPFWDQSSILL